MGEQAPTDLELWRRARKHDGAAFGTLFDRHHGSVYGYCRRRVGEMAAPDAVAVTFLEAWRSRSRADLSSESILPWLLAIARNVLSTMQRSQRRYARMLAQVPVPGSELSAEVHATEALDRSARVSLVAAALDQLPLPERQVLELCDMHGQTHSCAATMLSIPEGTAKSRLHRARRHMREALQRLGADAPIDQPAETSR